MIESKAEIYLFDIFIVILLTFVIYRAFFAKVENNEDI